MSHRQGDGLIPRDICSALIVPYPYKTLYLCASSHFSAASSEQRIKNLRARSFLCVCRVPNTVVVSQCRTANGYWMSQISHMCCPDLCSLFSHTGLFFQLLWLRIADHALFHCNGAQGQCCKIFKSLRDSDCLIWKNASEKHSK